VGAPAGEQHAGKRTPFRITFQREQRPGRRAPFRITFQRERLRFARTFSSRPTRRWPCLILSTPAEEPVAVVEAMAAEERVAGARAEVVVEAVLVEVAVPEAVVAKAGRVVALEEQAGVERVVPVEQGELAARAVA
jgi:hypothetical protein